MDYNRIFLMLNCFFVASVIGVLFYRFNMASGDEPHGLFDARGIPSQALIRLLDVLQVSHERTIESMVNATQKTLLRPAGAERWEAEDRYGEKKPKLMPLFDQLGMIQKKVPSQQHYAYVVLLGSLYDNVKDRLLFLARAWDRGVRFDTLVLLGGQRPLLHDEQESLKALAPSEKPLSETDMLKLAYHYLSIPQTMREVPVVFVDAPKPLGARRPTTSDTIAAWLSMQPISGSVLAVSSQPFIGYQDAVLHTFLPKDFVVETVGNNAREEVTTAVYLDTLARWLYQLRQQAE